jgi:hypothetical protein
MRASFRRAVGLAESFVTDAFDQQSSQVLGDTTAAVTAAFVRALQLLFAIVSSKSWFAIAFEGIFVASAVTTACLVA